MTAGAVEDALRAAQSDPEATPAQQAMLVALALAAAAETGVHARMAAWWAGRISRIDAAYSGATAILQAMAKALLAGEFFAEVEWQHRVRPKIIRTGEHERLTRALGKITAEAERERAKITAESLASLQQPAKVSDLSALQESFETLTMRAERVAHSEVITAGRQGYAEATAQAIGDDQGFIWRFVTDVDPCPRCVKLAARTFPTFESAPEHGGHFGCQCVLIAELRED